MRCNKKILKVICLTLLSISSYSKDHFKERELLETMPLDELQNLRVQLKQETASILEKFYYQENEEALKKAADFGSVHANYLLASLYYKRGNVKESVYNAKLAADQGHLLAQVLVASIYQQQKNDELAFYYFNLAADQEDSYAQAFVGHFHFEKKDLDKAEEYFLKSISTMEIDPRIYPQVQAELGMLYFLKEDYLKAQKYLKIASQKDAAAAALYEQVTDLLELIEKKDELTNALFMEYVAVGVQIGLAVLFAMTINRLL